MRLPIGWQGTSESMAAGVRNEPLDPQAMTRRAHFLCARQSNTGPLSASSKKIRYMIFWLAEDFFKKVIKS